MAPTGVDLAKYIGKVGSVPVLTMRVNVKVIDFKVSWGSVLLQVTPIEGNGSSWVNIDKFTPKEPI